MSLYFITIIELCGGQVPKWCYDMNVFGFNGSILAVLLLIFCNLIAMSGSRESKIFNSSFTIAKLFILAFIVLVAFYYFEWKNYEPFLTEEYGVKGVFIAATALSYSYLGFDAMCSVSEETINP